MKIGEHVRQGDVLIRKVKDIPANARELKRDEHNRIVLAHGESTGHAHAFRIKGICSLTTLDNDDIEFLLVTGAGGAPLNHELTSGAKAEHNQISGDVIDAGTYEAAQQVTHTRGEIIRMVD